MPVVDPSTFPDDKLRPWIVDDNYENEVSEAMSKFDETYSQTSYNRNAGCHTDSDLDKIRHDEIMEFACSQSFGRDTDADDEKDDNGGVDYLAVHDDDDSVGGEPLMLPYDESDEEEQRDDYVPLGNDQELLHMTSSMNNIDEDRFMKTHAMRLLLQKEKKKREDEFRSGTITFAQANSLKKIPCAKYMPTHKTRVYKEWVEAQKGLRLESMKSKAYLLDRPTTAFINSLIDQEREILAQSFSKHEEERLNLSEESAKRTQQAEKDAQKKSQTKDFNEQKKCLDKFNKLYPGLKLNLPNSPIATARPMSSGPNSRPATSDGIRPLTGSIEGLNNNNSSNRDGRLSPLRPMTAEQNKSLLFRKTKQTFDDKRCDMTLVLGLKDLSQSNFPSSNKDSIPSNNSAIVKYRTPREQMLDSITVTSKAEDDAAKRKANLRVKEANKALKTLQQKGSQPNSGRFAQTSRPATPLGKLGITPSGGALNNSIQPTVFLKPPKVKVKKLRDLMKTTSGVDSRLFNKGFKSDIPYDAQAERQKNNVAAMSTKEFDNYDSTTEALINPGFFEAMGPQRIYLSESSKFHSADERHMKQLATRERSHVTEGDNIRKWAVESLSSGRKLFHSGGGGFHYS